MGTIRQSPSSYDALRTLRAQPCFAPHRYGQAQASNDLIDLALRKYGYLLLLCYQGNSIGGKSNPDPLVWVQHPIRACVSPQNPITDPDAIVNDVAQVCPSHHSPFQQIDLWGARHRLALIDFNVFRPDSQGHFLIWIQTTGTRTNLQIILGFHNNVTSGIVESRNHPFHETGQADKSGHKPVAGAFDESHLLFTIQPAPDEEHAIGDHNVSQHG